MKAAVIEMNDDNPLLPVYNEAGVAINYRYIMSKARKRSLLKQDIRAPLCTRKNGSKYKR